MIQLSDAMLEQIIAGMQELRESRAEKHQAALEQFEKYREELARAMDEINENIRTSSLLDGMGASIGESTSRSEYVSHSYAHDGGGCSSEPKASQNDLEHLARSFSELKNDSITRLDFLTFRHEVEMQIERLKHVVSTLEDKVGGRCYATIHANSTMTGEDGRNLP
jgi:hypothetical protein